MRLHSTRESTGALMPQVTVMMTQSGWIERGRPLLRVERLRQRLKMRSAKRHGLPPRWQSR